MKTTILFFIFISLFLLTPVVASEIVHLTNDTGSVFLTPQWSPDGNRIVYISSPVWYKIDIWTIDSDGNSKKQITTGISGYAFNDPWSTDGTKLAYSSLEYWLIPGLWIYDVYTEEKHTLKGIKNIDSYQWVNGSKLFIVQEEDDTQKLWLVDPDVTNKSLLTTLSGENTRFLWQPNGNRILYTSNESGNYDVWIMDSDGSGKKQLTSTPEDEYAMGIAFSPDGNKIVYASRNTVDRTNLSSFEGFFTTVWTMDVDGTNKTKLALSKNMYIYPSWSPDGTKIAFECRNDSGRPDVVVMNADGSDEAILTANISGGESPQWSPKGDQIVFVSSKDGKTSVSVIILEDEWKSVPAKTMASAISQGNGKKSPGFTASLVMMAFLIVFVFQKRK